MIRIIDQRRLLHCLAEVELRTVDDFVQAIKEMYVRGAGLIGAIAAFGIYSATLAAPAANPWPFIQKAAATRLAAWKLAGEGVPHTLISDNSGGHLIRQGAVDLVIVGADRTTRRGDVANKIGTYLKALAAYDNNVPFYVALPSSTFDWQICDGLRQIPIEERSGDELRLSLIHI